MGKLRYHKVPFRESKARKLSEEESAYLAGIIDGEGMVKFFKRKDRGDERLYICVTNT